MANYLKILWQRLFGSDSKAEAELARIAVAQQAAIQRRAEYAQVKERAARTGTTPPQGLLSLSQKRVEEAEAAYSVALQAWDNKQSRQKSR